VSVSDWFKRHFALGIVISGTACSILAWMLIEWRWPWFLAPLHWLLQGVGSFASWLGAPVPVYRWWYYALWLYLISTLLGIIYLVLKTHYLNPRQYTQDTFFDVVWRWQYADRDGFIYNLAPFCPHCDRHLQAGNEDASTRGRYEVHDTLECREHGLIYRTPKPYSEFEQIVKDEIMLKVRNGRWKGVVERLSG